MLHEIFHLNNSKVYKESIVSKILRYNSRLKTCYRFVVLFVGENSSRLNSLSNTFGLSSCPVPTTFTSLFEKLPISLDIAFVRTIRSSYLTDSSFQTRNLRALDPFTFDVKSVNDKNLKRNESLEAFYCTHAAFVAKPGEKAREQGKGEKIRRERWNGSDYHSSIA